MDLGLADKVVWVTGGASGIGAAVVRALAEEGAVPVILDRDEVRARAVAERVARCGVMGCDLTDAVRMGEVVRGAMDAYGRLDGLVNNAGVNDGAGLGSGRIRASLEANLLPAVTLTGMVAEALRASRGAVVNIASKVAVTGQGGTSGYAAAKGALLALTREWAIDFAPDGVRVNAVLPAEVWTEMYARWIGGRPDPEASRREIERRIPLGRRMTTPDEIAAMVVFLLSPRSGHTTGQWIHVDGGYAHLDRAFPAGG
jgi:L-fucose dehydrogenase